jgi:hypothetical protein
MNDYLKTAGEAVLNNAAKVILSSQRLDEVDWLTKQQIERIRRYMNEILEKSPLPIDADGVPGLLPDFKKADVAVQNNAARVIFRRKKLYEIKWLTRQQIERVRGYIEGIMEKSPHPVEVENVLGLLVDKEDKGASADKVDEPELEEPGDSGDKK